MARSSQLQSDRGNPRLKFLDRYVGIPAVAALALGRRLRGARSVPSEWRTIGIQLTAGIGDTVVATGVLADLRVVFPDRRMVVFVTANNASFTRLLSAPDAVVELPVRRVWKAAQLMRAEHCDVLIDLGPWRRFDAALAMLSGSRVTVGQRTPGQYRHYGYDVVVDHQRDHEIDNDRRLVAAVGVMSTSEPHLAVPDGMRVPLDRPYVVFHLWPGGANFEERSWPVDHWRALADALSARGFTIVVTGGPGDIDATNALVDAWTSAGVHAHGAAGGTWPETLAWLGGAAGVVSVNTGVMHVAAALGTPTVALNGPTSATRWGPRGPLARSVSSPMIPDGYLDLGFERDDRYAECMREITVESVLAAWDELMAEPQAAQRG